MKLNHHKLWTCLLAVALPIVNAFAQKVSVGYDKSADFSKYKSYTWAQPTTPPSRPLLYLNIEGAIDYELKAKGLTRTGTNGDLILVPGGGMELGINKSKVAPLCLPARSHIFP